MSALRLTFEASGAVVELAPPAADTGFHIFLSHVWKYGQDQVATIKSMLGTMLPSCKVFLDVSAAVCSTPVAVRMPRFLTQPRPERS